MVIYKNITCLGLIVGLCTDGATAMTGRKSWLTNLVKKIGKDLQITHCIIHREMHAAKCMIPELLDVLASAVKVANFIKTMRLI